MQRLRCVTAMLCSSRAFAAAAVVLLQGRHAHGTAAQADEATTTAAATSEAVTMAATPDSNNEDDEVTPWSVTAKGPRGIDYDRVLHKFKAERVDDEVLQLLHNVVQERNNSHSSNNSNTAAATTATSSSSVVRLHHLLTRGIAFSHRDLRVVLAELQRAHRTQTTPRVYLYTGRGPTTASMHLGHVLPFLLTRYLQATFALPLVIQLTDDEKYLFRDVDYRGAEAQRRCDATVRDLIAFGLDPRRTFIFSNTSYMGQLYRTVLPLQRALTTSAVKHTLGLCDSDNVGKLAFCATQAAPCFAEAFAHVLCPAEDNTNNNNTNNNNEDDNKSATAAASLPLSRLPPMRCLIPCAIDQDPFFVLTRTVAPRLRRPPPALLHTRFVPALKGPTHKMSSSALQHGVITLHDSDDEVHAKVRKAYSGGCGTLQELQQRGARLDVDVAYQLIRFFCDDDALFADVTRRYGAGQMHSGEVKACAADVVIRCVLREWRARRARVTDADVAHFTSIRNIMVD